MVPKFTHVGIVYAWQENGEWFYAQQRKIAPSGATEMRRLFDGAEFFLVSDRSTSGTFIRNATWLTARRK